jgi:hypothetical protein
MIDVILNPPNTLERIDQVWAAVSVDEFGEGLCAINIRGQWMPLIAADEARLEDIRRWAKHLAATEAYTGKTIRIIRLSNREELETITP